MARSFGTYLERAEARRVRLTPMASVYSGIITFTNQFCVTHYGPCQPSRNSPTYSADYRKASRNLWRRQTRKFANCSFAICGVCWQKPSESSGRQTESLVRYSIGRKATLRRWPEVLFCVSLIGLALPCLATLALILTVSFDSFRRDRLVALIPRTWLQNQERGNKTSGTVLGRTLGSGCSTQSLSARQYTPLGIPLCESQVAFATSSVCDRIAFAQ
jgi:hypothetical protein